MIKERRSGGASTCGDVDGKKHSGTYNEQQVFIWSQEYSDGAKHERQAVIEKALQSEGKRSKDPRTPATAEQVRGRAPSRRGAGTGRLVPLRGSTPPGWRTRSTTATTSSAPATSSVSKTSRRSIRQTIVYILSGFGRVLVLNHGAGLGR